jgi:purine-binding chemotaxis protein CheW
MIDEKQYCTFYLEDQFFGVEVERVQEVFRYQEMTQVPLSSSVVRGLINLRGQIITAIDLRRRLGMKDLPEGQNPMNVVVRTDDDVVSLLVDRIGDVLEVSPDDFEPPPDTISGITRELVLGIYKLKGQLLLIIDTEKTIETQSLVA